MGGDRHRREPRIADLTDPGALHSALADATRIVCCAHARHAGAVIDAAPADARLIFLGSTRKFTSWPDEHGSGVSRRRGGVPRLRPLRRHAASHDDLRRAGRGQRAASRRPVATAADRAAARRRQGSGAADPPGRRSRVRSAPRWSIAWDGPHSAGDRRARPPALCRIRARRRTRGRIAPPRMHRAAGLVADGAAPGSADSSRCCRQCGPPKYADCWKTRRSTCDRCSRSSACSPMRCRKALRAPSLRSTTPDTRYRRKRHADHQPHRRVPP